MGEEGISLEARYVSFRQEVHSFLSHLIAAGRPIGKVLQELEKIRLRK